jgi:hypothetical protein
MPWYPGDEASSVADAVESALRSLEEGASPRIRQGLTMQLAEGWLRLGQARLHMKIQNSTHSAAQCAYAAAIEVRFSLRLSCVWTYRDCSLEKY